ncbi:glycosyltransferase [Photobacterium swingsii]|uniref:glycosyltransferase n=1 Tax=Photobacterium swingsii TaxID=680026 RepID=UPI0040681FB2
MKKVLILAYAISPTRGSEYNVGWNYIKQIAKFCQVDVLYGASGDHIGDTEELDNYLEKKQLKNINFIKVSPDSLCNFLNYPNKMGFGFFFYLAFARWQKLALYKAKERHKIENYSITHHLNPIGFREPGYLYRLGVPHIWGPIGGANTVDFRLLKNYSIKNKILAVLKNTVNEFQLKKSKRVKEAINASSALLFSTLENMDKFKSHHGVMGSYLPEQAIEDVNVNIQDKVFSSSDGLNLIFVGSVCKRKNLDFLFRVLSLIKDDVNVSLDIVGKGSEEENLKAFAKSLGLNKVNWHGHLPRERVKELMFASDLMCLCSTSEANTSVVFEAFSMALPTISLKQNGMADTLNESGFLINMANYETMVNQYSTKLKEIAENKSLLTKAKEKIISYRSVHTWDARGRELEEIYKRVLSDEKNSKVSG